ncbi:MAG: Holliday junction resolvase RuvX [Candidatus Neomarinimicrobiota bacterium]|nr:Holliday junction resolvase RuvX [Candidatus Neomarinimicrobiota bacterium]RKY49119.1 MAG: Holliday junction resolvase RuvX [Candidatus Neomarinimicrobiota bacterium]HDN59102.1 Holliday junction resolvase RuvX [Candidatus Neomarinimicrobiota bacterium]
MGRVLGIDYGDVRVGLALSDELKIISSPFKTVRNEGIDKVVELIKGEVLKNDVDTIVIGVPKSLQGDVTEQTRKVLLFIDKLRNSVDVPVEEVDERFSSVEAVRVVHLKGKKAGHSKDEVNKIAASIILQTYLDSISYERER